MDNKIVTNSRVYIPSILYRVYIQYIYRVYIEYIVDNFFLIIKIIRHLCLIMFVEKINIEVEQNKYPTESSNKHTTSLVH